ncbi:uncharacterized protein LOC118200575 [Stegodyphus dumicola]|uniref:uncharacterized protein LOC118200575 n=1 Tax=Stegodyphus dumicola TaxID=202533 RepID=UPI0015AB5B47|nr:uncharacterized protein LOC118200575 [Stegodyphus dumicola]
MEDPVAKLKSKRKVLRTAVSKVLKKIETELSKDDVSINVIEETLDIINEKAKTLSDLNTQIERDLKVVEDKFELEVSSALEYEEKIQLSQFRARKKLRELHKLENSDKKSMNIPNETAIDFKIESNKFIRLPKLTISKFFGDSSNWQEFWSQFEAAIHNNDSLSKVNKFSYLKSLLGEIAYNAFSGLSLTHENCDSAIELLINRFGRNYLVINAHMNKLLNLFPVRNVRDIENLRNLYDQCETQVRCLSQ